MRGRYCTINNTKSKNLRREWSQKKDEGNIGKEGEKQDGRSLTLRRTDGLSSIQMHASGPGNGTQVCRSITEASLECYQA